MDAKRPLGLGTAVGIGVNAIVGTSIFLFPGKLAGLLGPASILSFGLTGLLLSSVALCFAEASALFDRAGGPYLYAREAFGEWTGFGIGWLCWIAEVFSWAAVAVGIAPYLGQFGAAWSSPWATKAIAAAVIIVMGALNYRGVVLGAWTSNLFTAAKLIPLGIFILCGLPHVRAANLAPVAPRGWSPMGQACFLVFFAYSGFEVVPVPAGEMDKPEKNVPIAVIASLLLSAALYTLIQAVAVGVNPGLAGSERPLAESAGLFLGRPGVLLIVAGALLSSVGFNAGAALGGPRYLVALAADEHLPSSLASIHPRFLTPHLAVLATAGLALAMALLLDFNKLVDFTVVVVCAQYLSTCAAVPFLRRRAAVKAGFRLPLGLLVPIAGAASTVWLGAQGGPAELAWSAGTLAVGFLLRAAWKRRAAATRSRALRLLEISGR